MHTKASRGCCHDETKVVKLQVDQQKTQDIHALQAPDAVINIPSDYIVTSFYNADKSLCQQIHSPPLLTEQDTYLQICVFRI